jgi:hypothetical protein
MVAREFVTAVDETFTRIEANPLHGSPIFTHYRWVRTRKFPYVLFYRMLSPDLIVVYAVAHKSRRPEYWLGRRGRP